ncbi:MAG: TolC family protein [Candidatus Omnitrophica bacterium]|nr:TolC family protein [Candidatus Omnitrophota bacterium]
MNTNKAVFLFGMLFFFLAMFGVGESHVFAATTSGEPVKELQPAVKNVNSEVVPNEKRMTLNIDRGNSAGEKKFTIGMTPPASMMASKKGSPSDPGTGVVRGLKSKRPIGGIYNLQECIDIAVNNHLPLQIAKKSVRLAEMRLFEARRNLLPSASIDYQEYHGRISGQAYVGRKQILEGQQPIFRGGELFYTMKQSEVNLAITKNDYGRIRNDLVLQIKKAYYTLAKAKGNMRMQEDLAKEVERILGMVTRQAEAGIISKIEVLNVSSQASQAKYQLASAEGDLSIARLILKQAMNVDPKEEVDVKEIAEFKKVEVDYEKALSIATVNRPEMKINSMMIEYYNYGKGIAKAKFWPKVDLLGSWGLAKEEIAPDDVDTSNANDADQKLGQQWYAGLKVGVPLWGSSGEWSLTKEQWVPVVSTYHGTSATTMDMKLKILDKLDSYSEKQLSEIDFDKARQEFNKIRQDVTLEVSEGCFNYQKAVIQADTAANKVKYQSSDLELVKLKRALDEAQDSNVIESMIRLAQEKFGYLQALADCHITIAGINKAIGVEDYYKDE